MLGIPIMDAQHKVRILGSRNHSSHHSGQRFSFLQRLHRFSCQKKNSHLGCRISTLTQQKNGNGLDIQEEELRKNGAEKIYSDTYTGKEMHRPEFDKLLDVIKPGDRLIVTKLDRITRTATEGYELVNSLLQKGISVHVLNMGLLDNSATGSLILHIMFAFAEFKHNLILTRMAEGRAAAKSESTIKRAKYGY